MDRRHCVTIGFTARERFSLAAKSLTRLFENSDLPFNLVVVDGNTPERYRRQMDSVLQGRPNVQVIRRPEYLLPNAAKNLALSAAQDEYICLIENDCLVQKGWLGHLVQACEETSSDVAVPLLLERSARTVVHHDHHLGSFEIRGEAGHQTVRFLRGKASLAIGRWWTQRRLTQTFENHCLLMRRTAFEKIGPLTEGLCTDEHIDLALELHHAGLTTVFEPAARVNFYSPPPVEEGEKEFYFFRWNVAAAEAGNKLVREKWHIENMPRSYLFARSQHHRTNVLNWFAHRVGKTFFRGRTDGQPSP